MSIHRARMFMLALGVLTLVSTGLAAVEFEWQVVVNNGDTIPGDTRKFNSYNQPSLNIERLVVFRARSKGETSSEPAHGVFIRDMALGTPLTTIFDRETHVPYPNNQDSMFIEPPSFPRIDLSSNTIASRGNHPPAWEYDIAPNATAKAGTTGIYTNPFGGLITGASNLGVAPEFPFFAVPGTASIKFDVFPGAPAVTDGATLVFKGNYTLIDPNDPLKTISKTGVYYRDLTDAPAGGILPAVLLADTDTLIPGTAIPFGSTAPPSAAGRQAVFAGFDIEEAPTKGGIYLAPLTGPSPALRSLVKIGGAVPGERKGVVFNRLGEGVSFDGRFVAFWGAWGSETKRLVLQCGEEGNADRRAYCLQEYPDGFETQVPVYQGIFVYDTSTKQTRVVAKTPADFGDFVYWNFSGRVPGTGDDTGELARWRSSSFVAVSGRVDGQISDTTFHAAFKARRGDVIDGEYVDPIDGIYLRKGPDTSPIESVVETGMDGTLVDPEAVDPLTGAPLPVTAMGIERDGFRGSSLVINVSMATEEAGWAGIYLTGVGDGSGSLSAPVITKPTSGQISTTSRVTLSWNAVTGATGYDFYIVDVSTALTIYSGNLTGFSSTSTAVDLPSGGLTFGVRACSGGFSDANCGPFATVDFTVSVLPPTTSSTKFYTLTPCRIVDTRNAPGIYGGPALQAGVSRVFTLAEQCGIPTGTKAVSVNITVVTPTSDGTLKLNPTGADPTVATASSFSAGCIRANNAFAFLGNDGAVSVFDDQAAGTTNFIIDVNGYFK